MKTVISVLAAIVATAFLAGCNYKVEPIRWGADMCDQCRMIIGDKRFAAELVADRVYKFDGFDELAKFEAAHPEKKGIAYVADGEHGSLVPALSAVFLSTPDLTAPMGGHIVSFGSRDGAEQFINRHHLSGVRWLSLDEALAEGTGGADAQR